MFISTQPGSLWQRRMCAATHKPSLHPPADVTIGAWMLAFNTTPFDDRRMCEPACSNSSIAVYDFPKCAGLCEPAEQLLQLHASPACHAPALDAEGQLPRLPPILRFDAGPEEAVAAVAAHDAAEHSASGGEGGIAAGIAS